MDENVIKFLRAIEAAGGKASRTRLPCVMNRAEDRARQVARRNGLAVYETGGWRITDAGRDAISANTV